MSHNESLGIPMEDDNMFFIECINKSLRNIAISQINGINAMTINIDKIPENSPFAFCLACAVPFPIYLTAVAPNIKTNTINAMEVNVRYTFNPKIGFIIVIRQSSKYNRIYVQVKMF